MKPKMEETAGKWHEGQLRKDGATPYIEHPKKVAAMVASWGFASGSDGWAVDVAWAHDLLEETPPERRGEVENEILSSAGEDGATVLEAVRLLTNGEGLFASKEEYVSHVARCASFPVLAVKIADRICNTLDFIALTGARAEKPRSYLRAGEPLFSALGRFGDSRKEKISEAILSVKAQLGMDGAQEARWIWYPGDYGIWWGNNVQSRRLQRGARLAPFWPLYPPETRVLFRKDGISLDRDELLEVRCDGFASIAWMDGEWKTTESAATGGKFLLPKGAKRIEIKVWTAGWTTSWNPHDNLPVDSSARFTDPGVPPGLKRLPVGERKPQWVKSRGGKALLADFGEESYGYLRLKGITGKGSVKIIYAESEAEMLADNLANQEVDGLDGWEEVELDGSPEYRRELPHGFRYVNVIPGKDVSVGGLSMDCEWRDMPLRGSFRCSDGEINRIWECCARTLHLTSREVFVEGIKRDHWVWSGDAVQSFLMNYYLFGDYDGCRDTLWSVRGKDPVTMHLNGIMDYTFYWVDAVERYRLYSGDANIARQIYGRMKTLMDFAIGRLDRDGRPADRPDDWIFIDWAPKPLPNRGGVTSFEQMLLARALESASAIALEAGEGEDALRYRSMAQRLRGEILPRYWNAEKGVLMHMVCNDGRTDPMITRYPNIFGLLYGYFGEEQRASVKNALLGKDVMEIQTPYMRFYELEALCSLGLHDKVLNEIKSYWGGMLRLGATSFWELYNPAEEGESHYAMYGRRFGKSLCHAWGASPAYLLGKYFLGVAPTSAGFATYDAKPNLGTLEWMEGDVPTPWGRIRVKADRGGYEVSEIRE